MADAFNPYREWLGLEFPGPRPNHYQLLGLPQGEADASRIQQAAEQATVRVRSHRPGAYAADWARILDEILAAKNCLLDPQMRAGYDRGLTASPPATNAAPAPLTPGGSGISKLPPTASQAPNAALYPPGMGPAAPPPSVPVPAPRMEMQSPLTPTSSDLLPPGAQPSPPLNPAPAAVNPAPVAAPSAVPSSAPPTNPAPWAMNPAPLAPNPGLPPTAAAPTTFAPAYSPAMQPPAPGYPPSYPQAPAPNWGQPAAPQPSAWGQPALPAPGPMSPMTPAPAWGMPPAAPPMLPPTSGYPYSNSADPMAPAGGYGSPLPTAMPGMPMGQMGYPPAPVADPMAPAPYGAAPAYGAPAYGGPPASGYGPPPQAYAPQMPAYGAPAPPNYGAPAYAAPAYGAPAPYAAPYTPPEPTGYGVSDPMQPVGLPTGAYSPPMADPMLPTALPNSFGVPVATPQTPVAIPAGLPVGQAMAPAAIPSATTPTPVGVPDSGSTLSSVRNAPRPRNSGNSTLLLAGGGGVALLLVGVVVVVMNNQSQPVAVANNGGHQTHHSTDLEPGTALVKPEPTKPRPKPPSDTSSGNSSEEMPAQPEPTKPEPTEPKPTPEPAKPEPKPEPAPPEPKPEPTKPSGKPTQAQLEELSKLLTAARQELRELKFDDAQAKLTQAEALPKLEEQAAIVNRLEQLTQLAHAYQQAFEAGKKKLAAGQTLVVGASTMTDVAAVDDEKITVKVKGQERTFAWGELSQGLYLAIADHNFEADDPQKKVQKGAYLIAKASEAKEAERGKALWEEAGPLTAALLPVVSDKYDLAQLEAVASVAKPEMKPEPSENPSPTKPAPPGTPALALLKKARDEISGHQFSEAQQLLTQAEPMLKNDDERGKHSRLLMLANYTKQFKDAIDRTLARLESGETFNVGNTVVAVVEVKSAAIIVRVSGTNRTYQRTELPIGMAVVLGDKSLAKDTPETKLMRGAYVVACSSKLEEIEKAKTWWDEANRSGLNTSNLLPVITDKYGK